MSVACDKYITDRSYTTYRTYPSAKSSPEPPAHHRPHPGDVPEPAHRSQEHQLAQGRRIEVAPGQLPAFRVRQMDGPVHVLLAGPGIHERQLPGHVERPDQGRLAHRGRVAVVVLQAHL